MMDKFSYYLTDNNTVKPMNHFKALHISEDFFKHKGQHQLHRKFTALLNKFHPDRNASNPRAQLCYQRILNAYNVLSNPLQRQNYIGEIHASENNNQEEMAQNSKEKIQLLDQLLIRLKKLSTPDAKHGSKPGSASDSLLNIIRDFKEFYKSTVINKELNKKQHELFRKIKARAQTGNEFYELHLVSQLNPTSQLNVSLLSKAISQNHLKAMQEMVERIFRGHFEPLNKSLSWGLKCLRYLEHTILPKLALENTNSIELHQLKRWLITLKADYSAIIPSIIPKENKPFNDLVLRCKEYVKQQKNSVTARFTLNEQMFIPVEKSKHKKQHIMEELQALTRIIETLPTHIDSLENNNSSLKASTILPLTELKIQLESSVADYIDKRLANKITPQEAQKQFLGECHSAIGFAKQCLNKELGLDDYFTDFLKSIANVFINATNQFNALFGIDTRFTFFAPVKASGMAEVEKIEECLHENIGEYAKHQ